MKRKLTDWLVAGALLLQFVATTEVLPATEHDRIAIITSGEQTPYQDAVKGITEHLRNVTPELPVDVFVTSGDQDEIRRAIEAAISNDASLIVALGTKALLACKELPFNGPVLGALVLDERSLASMPNATGIVLRHHPSVQFDLLKRFLPDARRVGVLYSRQLNYANIEQARDAAEAAGLTLDAVAVDSPKEIPGALDGLSRRVDVLWGIPDAMVMSAATAKNILLASFRNRVPLVGPTASWTKAGALYSIEWNYDDIGLQAGEMALAVLDGVSINDIAPVSPTSVSYSVNVKTAKHCNVSISDPIIDGASTVFQ
jgi:putative ABC transport system substrate-binding protein